MKKKKPTKKTSTKKFSELKPFTDRWLAEYFLHGWMAEGKLRVDAEKLLAQATGKPLREIKPADPMAYLKYLEDRCEANSLLAKGRMRSVKG